MENVDKRLILLIMLEIARLIGSREGSQKRVDTPAKSL